MEKLLLDSQETARALNLSYGTLRNQIHKGTFPVRHVKRGARLYFKTEDVRQYVADLPTLGGEGR